MFEEVGRVFVKGVGFRFKDIELFMKDFKLMIRSISYVFKGRAMGGECLWWVSCREFG